MEELIEQEKKYLVEVLGKKLIDCDERDDRKYPKGHIVLAKKYWPEEYLDGTRKEVHHINFNHYNNVVSNLVVLTPSEHKLIHYMFDPNKDLRKQKLSESMKGNHNFGSHKGNNNPMHGKGYKLLGKNNGMYGKISPSKGKHRVYHDDGTFHYE